MNPKAIAALGIGYGALQIAQIGLGTAGAEPPQPPVSGSGRGFLPERRKRRDTDDDVLFTAIL